MVFGRPDIGKYLMDTFATSAASEDNADVEVDATGRAIIRQRDQNLDNSQKKSKAVLMKADTKLHLKNPPSKNKKNKQVGLPTIFMYSLPPPEILRLVITYHEGAIGYPQYHDGAIGYPPGCFYAATPWRRGPCAVYYTCKGLNFCFVFR